MRATSTRQTVAQNHHNRYSYALPAGNSVNVRESTIKSPLSAGHSAAKLLFSFLDLKAEYAMMKEDIRAALDKVLES